MTKKVKTRTDTVGKASQELAAKAALSPSTHTIGEQTDEQLSDYEKNLLECASTWSKDHPHESFYIVVLTKREKLMKNVIRNYFLARYTCPTPDYDQTVFHFDGKTQDIHFIWTIPDRNACFFLKDHALEMDPAWQQLVKFVMDFADGTLARKAMEYNGETTLNNPILTIGDQ